ncbi:MAG: exosortase-associated EpsI family protein [Pirellulales bacterium]
MKFLQDQRIPLTIVAILVATVLAGALHGRYSQRWGAPADIVAIAERLGDVPTQIGPWRMESSAELEDEVQEILRCQGSLKRQYINLQTGASVTVALLLGPAGPIAVHTPEICFSSRDYDIVGEKSVEKLTTSADVPSEFWASNFRGKSLAAERIRVYYGWSTGDGWIASDSARFEFSGQPWLYKIQVAGPVSDADPSDSDSCRQFLEVFVPAIQSMLASTKG